MKVVGIIAEFNPFHNGHKYLIDRCKRDLGADYVVIVMSGDFVQRGAPAIISKFYRAKMALTSGADAVLNSPSTTALEALSSLPRALFHCFQVLVQ